LVRLSFCFIPYFPWSDLAGGTLSAAFKTFWKGGSLLRVQLTHKLANRLDGIDVSQFRVSDIIELPDAHAALLIAEGWAKPVVESSVSVHHEPSKVGMSGR
jgi:hypothetical protein